MKKLIPIIFALLIVSVHASVIPALIDCNQMFSNGYGAVTPALYSGTTYSGMLEISLTVVFMVMTVLGVLYAIAYGFGINKLMTFTRTEFLESGFNIVLIAVVFSSVLIAPNIALFMTNSVVSVVSTSIATPTGAPVTITPATSTQGLYTDMCTYFINNITTEGLKDWVGNNLALFVTSAIQSGTLDLQPQGFGVTLMPFSGLSLVMSVLQTQGSTYFFVAYLGVALSIFLYIIYFLFPLFLYIGIFLRSFPWTRAAGGAFMALFIAFYIIFPALMYPFSQFVTSGDLCTTLGSYAATYDICNPGGIATTYTPTLTTITSHLLIYSGIIVFNDIVGYANSLIYVGVQLIGFIIALLVSLELLETLAQLLGAPSLRGGERLLGRFMGI